MELSILHQGLLWWVLSLVLGLPIVVVFLGELSVRLEQRGNPLAQGVRQLRSLAVPLVAVYVIVTQILGVSSAERWAQVIETIVCVAVIVCGLTFIRNVMRLGELNPMSWSHALPRIFFALARVLVLLVVFGYVLSRIWGIDLTNLTTALGVGSLVIALALQDTLSNLVSGFLLIADRPFKVGDTCEISGQRMEVQEVGWRTTRFASFETRGVLMIPNGSLGKEVIINLGQQGSTYTMRQRLGFSYDDPPNRVKQVLLNILLNIDAIIEDPPPRVIVSGYREYAIEYRLDFMIDFRDLVEVRDKVLSQVFYAAKRHQLTIPLPTRTLYHVDRGEATPVDARHSILGTLQAVPLFRVLPAEILQELAATATVRHYGAGERIVRQGSADEGLYVIQSGSVALSLQDRGGERHEIASLAAGDIFGEMALLRSAPSPFSVTVTRDADIIILDHAVISQLIAEHNLFASEMNDFIDERRRCLYTDVGATMVASRQAARDEVFNLLVTDASGNGV